MASRGRAFYTDGGTPVRMSGVSMDVTASKKNEEELSRAKEAAEAANRAKDEFLAILSHELRTPLTPVLAAVAILEEDPTLPPHVQRDLAMMRRNIEVEAHLIDDLLDVTTIIRGKLELNRRPVDVRASHPQDGWVTYAKAAAIAREVSARFAAGDSDEVILVYSEFVTALTQRPREVRLLPFAPPPAAGERPLPFEIEPSTEKLLEVLVPKAVEIEVYRALLENQAGEHAARMAAMESATRNTEELIGSLTLQFNRARQAAITKELVEIVSGAEAL